MPAPRQERVPLGILYMLGATVMSSAGSALSKWLVADYPIGEVLFTRSATSLIACSLFILPFTGLAVCSARNGRAITCCAAYRRRCRRPSSSSPSA